MTYDDFMLDLNKYYYDLWDIGLKKKANVSLKSYLQQFYENIDEGTRFKIWYKFCDDYFKDRCVFNWRYKNPKLPYEISKHIFHFLNSFPDDMPQIKWLYLLTNDETFLEKAFNHKECDQETINYKFLSCIDTLDWGAHHASEGIIIIKEELVKETISICLSMIEKYNISTEFQNLFRYYVRLYELLELFKNNNSTNFIEFCNNNDFLFDKIGVFYYQK